MITTAPDAAAAAAVDLNSLVSGGAGTVIIGLLYFAIKLILDRTIPSRSDQRASTSLLIEGLNNMVKILQEEKESDARRLQTKQERIESLETASDKDYEKIKELRAEISELRERLATKDRHIQTLVSELRRFGSIVTGVELPDLTITSPNPEINEERRRRASTGPIKTVV
jgi:predicted RNase H-like nuclease (RuvC/YqgF family)